MLVDGYDTTRPLDYLKRMLEKDFSRCGKVLNVEVFDEDENKALASSPAYVDIEGIHALEKALLLKCKEEGLENVKVCVVDLPAKNGALCCGGPIMTWDPVFDATAPVDPSLPKPPPSFWTEMSKGPSIIRYAPEDPSLPKPWKALVDRRSGFRYFWNTETNDTQYNEPERDSDSETEDTQLNSSSNYNLRKPRLPPPSSSNQNNSLRLVEKVPTLCILESENPQNHRDLIFSGSDLSAMEEKKVESTNKNAKKANLLDHHSIKHILDESVSEIVTSRGYREDVRLSNLKLILGVLILYIKEKNAILFTYPPEGSFTSTGLVVSSKLPRFSDLYTLTIDSADPKSISAGKSVQLTKSVTQWFTTDGVLVEGLFWKDVEALIKDYAAEGEPKKRK
ncbi:unnamed protein product [Microthlaspi erraticum]|uniref:Signal peptidase complex subunit 2 n=1 Tax=Microthlaspi erraticum TaxID=1685480 RepID=A0A6D2ITW6_9BRAS|nr:unnamed protein product [Microthlaspi erraticum]